MAAPMTHSISSMKKWGGKVEDYIDIHDFIDSTKGSFPDNRHRAILHNSFACQNIIPKIFGHQRVNSEGRTYNTKDVAEMHVLEDFRGKFIPSIQDYLENMSIEGWMNNGRGEPNSRKMIKEEIPKTNRVTINNFIPIDKELRKSFKPEGYID